MIARLTETGGLSTVDDGALYQHCQLFGETEALATAQRDVAATLVELRAALPTLTGATLVEAMQEVTKLSKLRAAYGVQLRQGRMAQRVYLTEFGLTPASRGRVKLPEKVDPNDPFAQFFDHPPTSTRPPL